MPPYFREFTVDRKAYKLKYTKRMAADDDLENAEFEASVEPMNRVGESGASS